MKQVVWFCLILMNTLGSVVIAEDLLFTSRAPQQGDISHQQVQVQLVAERTIRQQNQLVDRSSQKLNRRQHRSLEILQIVGERPVRARLVYGEASTKVISADNESMEAIQPIAENTYYVSRVGEKLTFHDKQGKPVTEKEDELLRIQMDAFGKPNPLAQFLNGKRIAIGETVDVPDSVASELLGLTGNKGSAEKLSLKLVAVKREDNAPCAVFETLLRTSSREVSTNLLMKGKLIIEPSTCRTRSIRLHGPVAMSESRGPSAGRFVVSTNGTLDVAVQTQFGPQRTAAKATPPRR